MKGLTSGLSDNLILLVLLVAVSALFVHYDILWRWDNLVYDAQLSSWERDVSEEIIIIAIDDDSLNKEGRWPWPRSKHADLINKLELENPRAIGLDIIFSEPDSNNPLSDKQLADAIKASGKVVLPLFMTQENRFSHPIEALPLPEFTQHAAALGHVHIDISDDGIARRVFLKEGIDKPQWSHYGVAMLSITDHAYEMEYFIQQESKTYSAMRWSKENPFLIPYAGSPGHFQRIGYSQVMAGQYPKNLFHNKIVLVGTTAEGLGDSYSTPLTGKEGKMPGVEIIANVIDAIVKKLKITELEKNTLLFITIILVALPLLFYPMFNPARAFIALIVIVSLTVMITELLFISSGLWIPLSTILLFQLISYPLWSWRRLAMAMSHINAELNKLTVMQRSLRIHRVRNITEELQFVSELLPITGWILLGDEDKIFLQYGDLPEITRRKIKPNDWLVLGNDYWSYTHYEGKRCKIGIRLKDGVFLSKKEKTSLDNLIIEANKTRESSYSEDVLNAKIQQLQTAGNEYQELRRIVDDSLSGMSDGVLICDANGQIMLSNRRVSWYLLADDNANFDGRSIANVFHKVHLPAGCDWHTLFKAVLLKQERVHVEAQHEQGRDLLVSLSPLKHSVDGFVANISDVSLLKASERKRNETLNFLSHDLRSPLTSIIAMIELAESKSGIDEMREMLSGMKSNTHKTLHLAEQFLQLSRANTAEKISFYEIDINTVALNAIDQIWGFANKNKVTIKQNFEHEEIWTLGEPNLLERAILNLLSNAIKHSPINSQIEVSVSLSDDEIFCCISDNGTGISKEELPHLFEMFRRTRDSGEQRKQGIGLGLAFVDAVAKRHDGRVDIESEQGKGSTFCIRFPKS